MFMPHARAAEHSVRPRVKWLTVRSACRRLDCSQSTLYRAMRSGALVPDGHVGLRPRFSRECIDAYVRRVMLAGDTERSAEKEVLDAHQAQSAEANHERHLAGRRGTISRRRMEHGSENGPAEEEG